MCKLRSTPSLPAPVPSDGMTQQRGTARRVTGYSPPKFSADDPALLDYLEEYGYAVVGAVADEAAIARAHDDFWAFHEGIGTRDGASQILRRDPATWGADFLAHPATGIITGYGFGQSRFCWNLRTLPDVPKVFSAIWGTDDLVTSFDGGAAFRPWSAADTEWKTQGGWWHCDQNATRPGRSGKVCVQGLVQLTPAHEYTGGFCVIPGSHKGHEAFSRRHPSALAQGDFLIVPDGDPLLQEALGFHMIRASPGDLILWDSRTIHCNGPALHPPESAPADMHMPKLPNELLRMVGYVCCTPSAWVARATAHKRAQAAIEKTTSTHWPHAFVATVRARPAHDALSPARELSVAACACSGLPASVGGATRPIRLLGAGGSSHPRQQGSMACRVHAKAKQDADAQDGTDDTKHQGHLRGRAGAVGG